MQQNARGYIWLAVPGTGISSNGKLAAAYRFASLLGGVLYGCNVVGGLGVDDWRGVVECVGMFGEVVAVVTVRFSQLG